MWPIKKNDYANQIKTFKTNKKPLKHKQKHVNPVPQWRPSYLKLFLDVGEFGELIAQLQRGQYRVFAGQREIRRTGQSAVRIYPGARVTERVLPLLLRAVGAFAEVVMRPLDPGALHQQHVHDLVFLAVGGQDDRRDIGWEPRPVLVVRVEVVVLQLAGAAGESFAARKGRMSQQGLHDTHVTFRNRQQERIPDTGQVVSPQEQLGDLQVFVADGQL